MSAFVHKALESPGLLRRVFGLAPKRNALAELNNSLASTGNVRAVGFEVIEDLNKKYRVDLQAKFCRELRELYGAFLVYCLKDRQFTQDEIDDLWHLKALFGISDTDHEGLYQAATVDAYKTDLTTALQDSCLSEHERKGLEQLSAYLQIPESVRKQTYDVTAKEVLQSRADHFTKDNELSPAEEAEILTLARSLGLTVTYDRHSTAALQKMRMLWQINNGQLPPLVVDINLQRAESCYLAVDVDWHETRRITHRVSYGGPSLRIKIAKGIYWNTGTYGVRRHSEDVLTKIDSGRVYLTNKRVIFDGAIKNQTIRLQKILDIIPYREGVQLEKDAGKSPFLELDSRHDVQLFVAILARLVRDVQ